MCRSAERVSLEKKPSTRLSQEPCFGVKHEGEASFGLGGEPGLGFLGDVRRVIVEDELDRGRRRIGGVELLQEGDELARTMSFLDAGVDHAGQKVDAGQQAQRSVPDIFVIARHARWREGAGGKSGAVVPIACMPGFSS